MSHERQATTLGDYIKQLQPVGWQREVLQLKQLFEWPPDVFAITSLLLRATGAYRRAASPPSSTSWPDRNWEEDVRQTAEAWRSAIMREHFEIPEGRLKDRFLDLEASLPLAVDALYESSQPTNDDKNLPQAEKKDAWRACQAILEIHCMADEAMNGVGVVHPNRKQSREDGDIAKLDSADLAFLHLQCSFLLTVRGSLARIPKFRGIVLPKSRTPQLGLSLRSLSNHLTFHTSEVDIAWRSFPWLNIDENSLHIMVVPWPFELAASSFTPVAHPGTREWLGSDRYFHYAPRGTESFSPKKIVAAVKGSMQNLRRLHMIVFPEMSLYRRDLIALQKSLEDEFSPTDIPMIVAGISSSRRKEKVRTADKSEQGIGLNQMVMSVYYVGRWYNMFQDKHHRWKIDESQIENYKLGGFLTGSRAWWEAIAIPRRRLSVMAANSWMTVCPLICEDLARLEPVSDLIRGIGPTLLVALLLDGPQIPSRWPARYASVFADDPGTAVLTLTALGMSRRTAPLDRKKEQDKEWAEKSHVVALWRDAIHGWEEIHTKNQEYKTRTLIASASWVTEKTIDGRQNDDSSATFVYRGTVERHATEEGSPPGGSSVSSDVRFVDPDPPQSSEENDGEFLDICELTLYTYFFDALVERRTPLGLIEQWIGCVLQRDSSRHTNAGEPIEQQIVQLIRSSVDERESIPEELPTPHLLLGIRTALEFFAIIKVKQEQFREHRAEELDEKYWSLIVNASKRRLEELSVHFRGGLPPRLATLDTQTTGTLQRSPQLLETYKAKAEQIFEEAREYGGRKRVEKLDESLKKKDGRPPLKPEEIGRIELATPLTALWAVHVRLSANRRFGTLTSIQGTLLDQIEAILTDQPRSNQPESWIGYHENFKEWAAATC